MANGSSAMVKVGSTRTFRYKCLFATFGIETVLFAPTAASPRLTKSFLLLLLLPCFYLFQSHIMGTPIIAIFTVAERFYSLNYSSFIYVLYVTRPN